MNRYNPATLTPAQLINAAAHLDPEVEPVPRAAQVHRDDGGLRAVHWDNPVEAMPDRVAAAAECLGRIAAVMPALMEQEWHRLPADGRRWVSEVTREQPASMADLLLELKRHGVKLCYFYEFFVRPLRAQSA